jgi:hypothetical protein
MQLRPMQLRLGDGGSRWGAHLRRPLDLVAVGVHAELYEITALLSDAPALLLDGTKRLSRKLTGPASGQQALDEVA